MAKSGCFRLLAVLAVALPATVPASNDGSGKEIITVTQALTARATWEGNDHQNYRYILHRQCYCADPNDVEVEVAGNRVVRVTNLANGEAVPDAALRGYKTIAELFAEIDAAVVRQPDSMTVEYDRYLGYPRKVRIDFSYRTADEELDYSVEQVTIR